VLSKSSVNFKGSCFIFKFLDKTKKIAIMLFVLVAFKMKTCNHPEYVYFEPMNLFYIIAIKKAANNNMHKLSKHFYFNYTAD